MAKRVRKSAEPESTTTVKAITPSEFTKLNTKVKASERVLTEERGSLGGIISDAVEHKHLHKGAYAAWRKIDKMSAAKRAEFLFHFDLYRERTKTWTAQADMMPDRADGEAEAEDDDSGEAQSAHPGVNGEQLGAAMDEAAAGQDDEVDVRPRHLRSGSAADPKLN